MDLYADGLPLRDDELLSYATRVYFGSSTP